MYRLIVFTVILLLISNISILAANNFDLFINGQHVNNGLDPLENNEILMVKARALAEKIDAQVRWYESIKTLHLKKDDTIIKMMVDNNYIQVNNKTSKSKGKLKLINGSCYVPVQDVVENLGYLYQKKDKSVYISKPENYIKRISWQKEGQQLLIEMNKLSPYRINTTEDPERLELELERAALAEDFSDDLSNNNFYLKIDRVVNQARLKITVISKYPIPYQRDRCIEEDGNNIIINFLPYITTINWEDQKLEIGANGDMQDPEFTLLENPRRMVVDIPGLMLNDFEMNLPENNWIKDIRVSQFKYDPVILRVVLELYPARYLHLVTRERKDKLILKPTQVTTLEDLSVSEKQINFYTDQSTTPDIFTLQDPDRLVINIFNSVRGKNIPDKLKVNGKLINNIRSARFNQKTVRIVADLSTVTGYNWQEKRLEDGRYQQIISFKNSYQNMIIKDSVDKTDININFSDKVEYKVKKFAYPDRIAVDIKGLEPQDIHKIPEVAGLIKDIKVSSYNDNPVTTRISFKIDQYYKHKLFSLNPDSSINLSLLKKKDKVGQKHERKDKGEDIIVIDPGHGGFDPGAIGSSGLKEKDVNLDVARRTKKLLINAGYNVFMTREKDVFISLKDRVDRSNELKAIVFVSIHNNSSNSSYSEGTETYIAPDKVTESKLLADLLQKKMLADLKRLDRGTKLDNFYVIKHTDMPAALVEIAFLSNPHEESLLENDLFKEKAARAIADGIIAYIEKIKQGDEVIDE